MSWEVGPDWRWAKQSNVPKEVSCISMKSSPLYYQESRAYDEVGIQEILQYLCFMEKRAYPPKFDGFQGMTGAMNAFSCAPSFHIPNCFD